MSKMWNWYKTYSHKWFDVMWTAAVVVLCFTVLRPYWPVDTASQDTAIFASIATIAGTLLGFSITSISVLIVFLGGDEFDWLRNRPDYEQLFADFKRAVFLFGLTTVAAVIALLINDQGEAFRSMALLGFVLWLSLLSGITLVHAMRILSLAIKAHSMVSKNL